MGSGRPRDSGGLATRSVDLLLAEQGDQLFAHLFDDSGWRYNYKEFNQVYKAAHIVRWRQNPDAPSWILAASNPCDNAGQTPCKSPWPDTMPPIEFSLTMNGTIPVSWCW